MQELIGPASEFHSVKVEWSKSQDELEEAAFLRKKDAKRSYDQIRNKDLAFLKPLGGPFTNIESLEEFVKSTDILEKVKQMRLYSEVRFAKYSSVTLKRDDEMFRLMRAHKKLSVSEYYSNLRLYLSQVSLSTSATMTDFKNAVSDLLE